MTGINISMPHPVLGIPDDMDGAFHVRFKITMDRQIRQYVFSDIMVEISNVYLASLYEAGKLDFVLKISCVPTYMNWTFLNPRQFNLPENEVDIILETESFLLVRDDKLPYYDDSFSSVFEEKVFDLVKGDIVGLTGTQKIPIEKDNEKATIGSIFRFEKIDVNSPVKELHFDFDADQIVIYYPSANTETDPITFLFDKKGGAPFTALNLYVIPALEQAFKIITDEQESGHFGGFKWFTVLDTLLPRGMRHNDNFINAQKVIRTGVPVNFAFEELLRIKNIKP
ncbi:MAG: hypothetical protein DI539_13280 [Flavobacterium psychrophilum]|nr:MAG: hypothetical protein DI539_13280 [Flavobacterium psychrophilum]